MIKLSFEEVATAVEKVCRGFAVGALVGALSGGAFFVIAVLLVDGSLQPADLEGRAEFGPVKHALLTAYAGAFPGIFVGGSAGALIRFWRLFRIGRLKLR